MPNNYYRNNSQAAAQRAAAMAQMSDRKNASILTTNAANFVKDYYSGRVALAVALDDKEELTNLKNMTIADLFEMQGEALGYLLASSGEAKLGEGVGAATQGGGQVVMEQDHAPTPSPNGNGGGPPPRQSAPASNDNGPSCPKCSKPMKLRDGRQGPFYGCTGYPECKGTRNAA